MKDRDIPSFKNLMNLIFKFILQAFNGDSFRVYWLILSDVNQIKGLILKLTNKNQRKRYRRTNQEPISRIQENRNRADKFI